MDLNKTQPAVLVNTLNNIKTKEEFYNFLRKSIYPSQLDLTLNPVALKNLQIMFKALDYHKGDKFICELKDKDQFRTSTKKRCHFPEIISRANTIKKIGADSVNGIVFLIQLGNFKFIVKNAIAYNADPLDYEYHIQDILNPLRKWIPNYSLGYFYFNCKINNSMKMKSIILNEGLNTLSTSFEDLFDEEIEDYSSPTKQKYSTNILSSKENFEGWFSSELYNLESNEDMDEYIESYYKMLNLYKSVNFGNLCITKPEREQYKKQYIVAEEHNLFIATEISSNPISLEDYCEKNPKDETLVNIILQLLCALHYGWEYGRFTHYDLHAGNVLLTKLPKPMVFVYHFPGTKMPLVPIYTEYMITIIDFGRSYVDGKKFYFDVTDPEGKNSNYQFNSDSNLMPNRPNACYDLILVIDACDRTLSNKSSMKKFQKLYSIIKKDFAGKIDDGELEYPHTEGQNIKNCLDLIYIMFKNTKSAPLFPNLNMRKILFSSKFGSTYITIKNMPLFQKLVRQKNSLAEKDLFSYLQAVNLTGGSNNVCEENDMYKKYCDVFDSKYRLKQKNNPRWSKKEGRKLLKKYRNMHKQNNKVPMDLDGGINLNYSAKKNLRKIQKL